MSVINTRILKSPHAVAVIALTALALTYALALIDPWGVAADI